MTSEKFTLRSSIFAHQSLDITFYDEDVTFLIRDDSALTAEITISRNEWNKLIHKTTQVKKVR